MIKANEIQQIEANAKVHIQAAESKVQILAIEANQTHQSEAQQVVAIKQQAEAHIGALQVDMQAIVATEKSQTNELQIQLNKVMFEKDQQNTTFQQQIASMNQMILSLQQQQSMHKTLSLSESQAEKDARELQHNVAVTKAQREYAIKHKNDTEQMDQERKAMADQQEQLNNEVLAARAKADLDRVEATFEGSGGKNFNMGNLSNYITVINYEARQYGNFVQEAATYATGQTPYGVGGV
jgi:hypothetical protein